MMRALATNNKSWVDSTANIFLKENGTLGERISKFPIEKQDEELVVTMGPCHYANIALNGIIVTISKKYKILEKHRTLQS
jgi:hypothetical protein